MNGSFYTCKNCGSNKVNCHFHIEKGGSILKNTGYRPLMFESRLKALNYAILNNIYPPIDIYATSSCEVCQHPNQIYTLHSGFRQTFNSY